MLLYQDVYKDVYKDVDDVLPYCLTGIHSLRGRPEFGSLEMARLPIWEDGEMRCARASRYTTPLPSPPYYTSFLPSAAHPDALIPPPPSVAQDGTQQAAETAQGLAHGPIGCRQVVDALHHLQQLRRQGCATIRRHRGCRAQQH